VVLRLVWVTVFWDAAEVRVHVVAVTVVVVVTVILVVAVTVMTVVTVVVVVAALKGLGRDSERALRRAKETRATSRVAVASCRVTLKPLSPLAHHPQSSERDQNWSAHDQEELRDGGKQGCSLTPECLFSG